ncbi:hypothetical protein Plim_0727 [Planctopirus limnophila DSM 3776]|uniref:ABC-type transport auxiliary lipoprotein component domain-containing protein n=1 Tax=Planctopirus limnophila (strain ATCC 43296 / DSM 3776 / IFAM 1008 / Mu 290) TaxID=521674 RepID=D5SRN9_PLAL2|nr:LptE family protein [Planctopirus limnophila]ADG66573.1 hypothetical protein Plim_0727 [Planctopirus limnophila DSM 3776]
MTTPRDQQRCQGEFAPRESFPAAQKISRRDCLAMLSTLPWVFTGCGYTIGKAFSPQIRTVTVPIFENDTFRRGIEYQLTEAVQREIRTRTPFKLVNGDEAETRLSGKIVEIRKDVLGETTWDDPRELQFSLMVHVTWEDLRSGEVLGKETAPLDTSSIAMASQADFAPEVGQSLATATADSTSRLARRIVNMMETPW